MQKLVRGIHRFQAGVIGSYRSLFDRLAQGQHPQALFITCSDSRIDPCLITQSQPGDLFILRNAGNIVAPPGAGGEAEEATIEFAVAGLGVRDLIVCGHTLCGAMKGLLSPASLKEMPAVARWLRHADATRRIIEDNYADAAAEQRVTLAAEENVLVQIETLRTHPAVAVRLARGELNLHAWMYKIETGEVFAFDGESGQYRPITEHAPAPLPGAPRRLSVSI